MARAAVTIVSKNYLPQARVLAKTFREHHPDARFFVFLVDRVDGYFDPKDEPFTLVEFESVPLPSDAFRYYYSILELNTAVKPFVLEYLFSTYPDIVELLYIDPDIQVYRELRECFDALSTNAVVLTPHMRKPFHDNAQPSEVGILQSGTYNLGFIGLRRSDAATELLRWWQGKLYLDCVVDIPNGLFVDQKWMDLVPAYFPDMKILHDPTYNVAYWNMHEREVYFDDSTPMIEGRPVSFFHFSGYSPKAPDQLSKHQNRHDIRDHAGVQRLCAQYARMMGDADTDGASKWPFAFASLPNNVVFPACLRAPIRFLERHSIAYPSPLKRPGDFCAFAATPCSYMPGSELSPVAAGVLMGRADVANHYFAGREWRGDDVGFQAWLSGSGRTEERIGAILDAAASAEAPLTPREELLEVLARRPDVMDHHAEFCGDVDSQRALLKWIETFGRKEEGLGAQHARVAPSLLNEFYAVLSLYMQRLDLQQAFPRLYDVDTIHEFASWLYHHHHELAPLSALAPDLFRCFALANIDYLTVVTTANSLWLRKITGISLSLFTQFRFERLSDGPVAGRHRAAIREWLSSDRGPSPLEQVAVAYHADALLQQCHPRAFKSGDSLRELVAHLTASERRGHGDLPERWLRRLNDEVDRYSGVEPALTIVGYFDMPTGLGYAARSLALAAEQAGFTVNRITLPNPTVDEDAFGAKPNAFMPWGNPAIAATATIVVTNADTAPSAVEWLPPWTLATSRRIGYWVWETEELPASMASSEKYFDEIWTSSTFAQKAIAVNTTTPIAVLPYAVESTKKTNKSDAKNALRLQFGLPVRAFAFGYVFDQRSVFARKNPAALLDAFEESFADDNDTILVFKVSDANVGQIDYRMFRERCRRLDNVHLIEETWTHERALQLLSVLDTYVSPHRSEGFGLTIAEAAILGVPVIATKYSGSTDILSDEMYLPIDASRTRLGKQCGPYPAMHWWCEPSHDSLVQQMQRARDGKHPDAKLAAAHIRKSFSHAAVGRTLRELLQER